MDNSSLMAGLTVLVLAGVVFFAGSAVNTGAEVTGLAVSSSSQCVDVDARYGPDAVYLKNFVSLTGTTTKVFDVCASASTLTEQTCNSNAIVAVSVSCPAGCASGACIKPSTQSCLDTDGNVTSTFGTVTTRSGRFPDVCVSAYNVAEQACKDGVRSQSLQYCPNGCSNGKCN